MSQVVHLVGRWDALHPDPVAEDLLSTSTHKHAVRVVELFDPAPGAPVVDLSLAERDLPEVVTALNWADEVHLHRVHPRLAVHCLPFVRPADLQDTPLIVHGPCKSLNREPEGSAARLASWPGPRLYDRAAAVDVEGATESAPCLNVIDLHDPSVLPRSCGPVPLMVEDGRRLAVVALCPTIPEALLTELQIELPAVSRSEIAIEIWNEVDEHPQFRTRRRRVFQCAVLGPESPRGWSRTMLEVVAQGLPAIVLGPQIDNAPPGVMFTGERSAVDRCVAYVRSWSTIWVQGEPAPCALDERRSWFADQKTG